MTRLNSEEINLLRKLRNTVYKEYRNDVNIYWRIKRVFHYELYIKN